MSKNILGEYKILIADSDQQLSQVVRDVMSDMGFSNLRFTKSGREALSMMMMEHYDFVITEWNTQHINGLEMIRQVRRNPDMPNPTIPIIMLTGRAEQSDVMAARDCGINEYVVKPFSAKNIYSRLERIIEQPRNFVISQEFVGPCRRQKGTPPPGVKDRRVRNPAPQSQPKIVSGNVNVGSQAKIWLPDFSLKMKLGKNLTLKSLITPAVLDQAQAAIEAIGNESLQWIKDNLRELKLLHEVLVNGSYPPSITVEISEVALSINSRAGTFGYTRASEVAYKLYLFCRNSLNPTRKEHHLVIQKHIEVLQVIFGNQMRGDAGAIGQQIVKDLKALIDKHSR